MTIWWLILLVLFIIFNGSVFIYIVLHLGNGKTSGVLSGDNYDENGIERNVNNIFDDEFREELRNRGRLHFEKIITENAMFLQQDLQLTTSQLNDYLKNEITHKLQDEFSKYEASIADAKQLAVQAIQKTNAAIEEQRKTLYDEIKRQIEIEKAQMVDRFEKNMAKIINHYVLMAIGNQIDLNDQLEYILGDLETNKQAMIEDINNGS